MKTIDVIALLLVITGGIAWGLIGAANYNPVDAIFGVDTAMSSLIYVLVGLAALWTISILARTISRRKIMPAPARPMERPTVTEEETHRETVPPSDRVRR